MEEEVEVDHRGWQVLRVPRTQANLGIAFEGGHNVLRQKLPRWYQKKKKTLD